MKGLAETRERHKVSERSTALVLEVLSAANRPLIARQLGGLTGLAKSTCSAACRALGDAGVVGFRYVDCFRGQGVPPGKAKAYYLIEKEEKEDDWDNPDQR